ncbi:hypothetical protein EOQ21_04325 [Salmonella bongori serovar 48:i:-]|nr:hypothetical protein [Salmonella bongori serovar 48:i:-]
MARWVFPTNVNTPYHYDKACSKALAGAVRVIMVAGAIVEYFNVIEDIVRVRPGFIDLFSARSSLVN